jgi:hypothetical protein
MIRPVNPAEPGFRGNREVHIGKPWGVTHVGYRGRQEMFEAIVDKLVLPE